jgi:O-acetylhomoserine/O-acetylserine sulfhydrylase-like pyridoxal-dependent enzyme
MEGTEAAMATASGMAAIMLMCWACCKAGDHVMCSQSMFGSTIKLIGKEFARLAWNPPLCRRPTWTPGAPPCGPTPSCCLPRRRPTR